MLIFISKRALFKNPCKLDQVSLSTPDYKSVMGFSGV